jgi:hypothetical protein
MNEQGTTKILVLYRIPFLCYVNTVLMLCILISNLTITIAVQLYFYKHFISLNIYTN